MQIRSMMRTRPLVDGERTVSCRAFLRKSQIPSLIVAMIPALTMASLCTGAERATSMVRAALRAEIELDIDARSRLLDEAVVRDPKLAEAHWARGEVRVNGRWRSLEVAASEAINRHDLQQYEVQRSNAADSVQDQERMAEYCHQHRLPAQERAHWNAVLAVTPNHALARQRLGQVNRDGTWIEEQQLEAQRKTERATYDYILKHGKELLKLVKALDSQSLSREKLVQELGEFRDPLAIAWIEYLFSSRGEAGGLCTVATLETLPSPEASLSLVRHALDFPHESVRLAAIDSLKQRDEYSFIPVLLGALRSPVRTRDEFSRTANNELIWRRSVSVETQDAKKIAVLDRVFSMDGFLSASDAATVNWTRQTMQAGDRELAQLNQNISTTNTRVIELLHAITEDPSSRLSSAGFVDSKKSPEDWWNWWNDRIESYPADGKSVQTRYELAFVPPSVVEFPSGGRHECLAPGTEIWTEVGPQPIEQLQTGDLVLTQNQRTGELKFAPVLSTSQRPPESLLTLKFGSETIRATGGHPFWVSGKGWIKARSLTPGMGLHTARGVVMLDDVEIETQRTATHNLIVDECHAYFVGHNLILSPDNTVREPVANPVPGLRYDEAIVATKK